MRAAYTISLAVAVAACGDDALPLVEKGREAVRDERRARATSPLPTSEPLVVTPPPLRPRTEGAASAELVFARAQKAIASDDHLALLQCLRPSTRARWLRDLVVAMAVVSTDDGTDHDEASVAVKRSIRDLLRRYGAYARGSGDLSADAVGAALLEKVKDPDGLYVALLGFASDRKSPLDPVRAVQRAPRGARAPEKADVSAAALIRLVERVRAPHELTDLRRLPRALEPGDGPTWQGLVKAPDARPSDVPFLPVNFFDEAGITWLDES